MTNLLIALFAYILDRIFGEFTFMKHPVVVIGEMISFFEEKFYKDSITRGALLVVFVLTISGGFALAVDLYFQTLAYPLYLFFISLISSIFIAHRMLRDTIFELLVAEDKNAAIAMLVSRDTKDLSESEVYKAAIETYGENLSDGVVAPLFYLLLFGPWHCTLQSDQHNGLYGWVQKQTL